MDEWRLVDAELDAAEWREISGKAAARPWGPFSCYFPRPSAQVQPVRATRPPEPPPGPASADLIRLVEKLREQESRLRTELLEHKILKDTVAIVSFLESDVVAPG